MSDVTLDSDAVDDALGELESLMRAGEQAMNHEEVRPSSAIMATSGKNAYRTLVEAHPDYDLNKGGSDE